MGRISRRTLARRLAAVATLVMAATVSGLVYAAPADPGDANVKALARTYNSSAADVLAALGKTPGNIVLSPYSVGTAMAMALAGAAGDTAREMAKTLRHALPSDAMLAANAALAPQLARTGDGAGAARVAIANALFVTSKFGEVAKDYAAMIVEKFGGEIFPRASLDEINAFVNRKTQGKIEKILDKLSPNSAAVLVNAIYFKAPWAEPFAAAQTRDDAFKLVSGETITVPTMHRTGRYAVAAQDGFRAIRLPYSDDRLAMIIVVPEDVAALNSIAAALDAGKLAALAGDLAGAAAQPVALSLPRFKASYEADLVPVFRDLGMTLAFDAAKADFSGITGRANSEGDIAISQIKHRALIEVNEEGSEAAAATAVEAFARSAARPEGFKVDRAFLFYIADAPTGAVLFSGRIVDPR